MVALLAVSNVLLAQKAAKNGKKQNATTEQTVAPIPNSIRSYLGGSGLYGGPISKRLFDSYLSQGLIAKDSMGNQYKVDGFTFGYAERNLYEDSVGNLMVLTDYLSEFCPGDSVSAAISNNIYHKTKPGDTAYFENVKVALPDGKRVGAKSMKFVLTK